MPLSWNEIKSRAIAFSKEWETETSEDAEAKSFWDGFFNIFGISRKRVASFEEPVKKLGEKQGFIDLFWKGILLVEHKSRGKNLDRAYKQALDYFPGILERDLPKYILVSDFARFRLFDLEENEQHDFDLRDLHKNIRLFGFVAGYQRHKIREEDPVNIRAAENMGRLHDQLKEIGYDGHQLELYLVRLLFCLFAEDTGIFERQTFQDYIEERTNEDGSDLAYHIAALFQVLNTQENKRLRNLDEQLGAFPYVNGKLFEELLPNASFDSKMRQTLLDCCALDWSRISPAIFGSLFQSIMDKTARRNLGAHYTSEKNILKLIKPLFLDALWEEFNKVRINKKKLAEFHQKLRSLKFLDPACGCGNFLVIAYRELRLLELEILRALHDKRQQILDVQTLIKIDVDQFYGIEIEEFPAQIAQVALWLVDHQMNMQVSEEFGLYFARIPLHGGGTIICANALQIDWNDQIKNGNLSYIIGNPPFIGASYMSQKQKSDLVATFHDLKNCGVLDFVTCWYRKAAEYLKKSPDTEVAFVSTNSICQGEQVPVLWRNLLTAYSLKINFAHQTFKWSNEAKGKAAVYCVIVGFAMKDWKNKRLFVYDSVDSEPQELSVSQLNPYLIDAPTVFIESRTNPLCKVPKMTKGCQPTDGGHLIIEERDYADFIKKEPEATQFIKRIIGAEEFIKNKTRYCLWLVNCPPNKLSQMPLVLDRVKKCKEMREKSTFEGTRKLALMPTVFRETYNPESYIVVPSVSSERRKYVPVGFLDGNTIATNLVLIIPDASLYDFGVITSTMHMEWMRYVCGRLEMRYRYSKDIVYNNFPWPDPTEKQKIAIEVAAQGVLSVRNKFPEASMADLYDPLKMPPELVKAHQNLDRAVDAAYGKTIFKTEADRVAFLFEQYQQLCNLHAKPLKERIKKIKPPQKAPK